MGNRKRTGIWTLLMVVLLCAGMLAGCAGKPESGNGMAKEAASYLKQCSGALNDLQNRDSYTVKSVTNNFGGPILNETSSYLFYKRGQDWLKLGQIPDEGFDRGFWPTGFMFVDGIYYDNLVTEWDENEDILWGVGEYQPTAMPWITRFDWDAQEVAFVSAAPAGSGQCITLQVMAPYRPENEASYGSYQSAFIFDKDGNLVRVENAFYFCQETGGDYGSVETIWRLEDFAETVIDTTYEKYLNQQK